MRDYFDNTLGTSINIELMVGNIRVVKPAKSAGVAALGARVRGWRRGD
jgi:hypothetical protein